jgi:hypothetical protein
MSARSFLRVCSPDARPRRRQRPRSPIPRAYLDNTGRDDVLTGGVKMVPITTPKGTFKVWTKRVGNSPTMKVLLLHGGPGATHEYMEAFDSYFPAANIEYYSRITTRSTSCGCRRINGRIR